MYGGMTVGVVVPARDEERNIGPVVAGLLALRDDRGARVVDDFVVCDNGSTDATAARARAAGARVVREGAPGYGVACLTALAALRPVDVVLFTDGDVTDYRSTLLADKEKLARFTTLLRERGVFKGETKFYVSVAHTQQDVDRTIEAFASGVQELR